MILMIPTPDDGTPWWFTKGLGFPCDCLWYTEDNTYGTCIGNQMFFTEIKPPLFEVTE
jgi:hypothetical protein